MRFADFDIAAFLRDYWQKRPCLIKNPWVEWVNSLEPDDLAGLACDEDVESRLVTREPKLWRVEHGPFEEERFGEVSVHPWTLLVQAVDHAVPDVAALIAPFRFVPNWRIDDVMVSYAVDGGGVGPHFDQYDVFLVQGLGRRRWRLGGVCDAETPLVPDEDLRLLADFTAMQEFVLEPGDILYVPPGVAHDGVALGDDCMTYSVGFRAPARSELVAHWCDDVLGRLSEDDRYGDPALAVQENPGEITAKAMADLQAMVLDKLADAEGFARWFGQYSSTPKYPDLDWQPEEPAEMAGLRAALRAGQELQRNPASRFSFYRQADGVVLFVDGASFDCAGEAVEFAEAICASESLMVSQAVWQSDAAMAVIVALFNKGSVGFDGEFDGEED